MKTCTKCGLTKPANTEYFGRSGTGLVARCKDCLRAYGRVHYQQNAAKRKMQATAWKKDNPDKVQAYRERSKPAQRLYHLKYNYGLTEVDYQTLLQSQKYACAICKRLNMKLQVDHSHETGEVRGLLCPTCNRVLGMFIDKPELFRRAADYLQDFNRVVVGTT